MAMAFSKVPDRVARALEYIIAQHDGKESRVQSEWEAFLRERGVRPEELRGAGRNQIRRWRLGETRPNPYRDEFPLLVAFVNERVPKKLQIPSVFLLAPRDDGAEDESLRGADSNRQPSDLQPPLAA